MNGPNLGSLIEDGDRRRDAIHIAVAPVTAAERLQPSQHVGLVSHDTERVGAMRSPTSCIGIVDPFLTQAVEEGQRFWLFLYPNTVTSLRHAWTHPAFTASEPVRPKERNEDDHQAFLAAIRADPLNHLLRCQFADWLDEHGEVDEATRQRQWNGAYEYLLKNFVDPYGEYGEDLSPTEVLEELEDWQRRLIEDGEICFVGNEAEENMQNEENPAEFFRTLEIVTGTKIQPEIRERATFRCVC
jgi:uncharacterized protein (TIGR02996 family)